MEMVIVEVELHKLEATMDPQAMDHHRAADQVEVLEHHHHPSGSHSSEGLVEEHLQEEVEEAAVERRLVGMEASVMAEAAEAEEHHPLEDPLHPSSLCLIIPRSSR